MLEAELLSEPYSDLTIVNSARVSFDKHKTEFDEDDRRLMKYLYKHGHWTPFAHPHITVEAYPESEGWGPSLPGCFISRREGADKYITGSLWFWVQNFPWFVSRTRDQVLSTLYQRFPEAAYACELPHPCEDEDHSVVIEDPLHTVTTFRMSAPVPIRTQCFKHKVGFVENEVSRRYVNSQPAIFYPDTWRKKPDQSKQGSAGPLDEELQYGVFMEYQAAVEGCLYAYEAMINAGVAPEQARFVLPQGMMTMWYWTSNLVGFRRFVQLRTEDHAQGEVTELAEQVDVQLSERYGDLWVNC